MSHTGPRSAPDTFRSFLFFDLSIVSLRLFRNGTDVSSGDARATPAHRRSARPGRRLWPLHHTVFSGAAVEFAGTCECGCVLLQAALVGGPVKGLRTRERPQRVSSVRSGPQSGVPRAWEFR